MSANQRIQWFHRKIADMSYPNSKHLAERFSISHRQAQRDVSFMKTELNAPIEFDHQKRGYYYTSPYSLPVAVTAVNDEEYSGLVASVSDEICEVPRAENTVVQMQLPYSATLKISDGLAAVEIKPFIKADNKDGTYLCEFHSIEKFMGVILSLDAEITILKPDWLRSRIVRAAERIIRNNTPSDPEKAK